MTESMLLTRGYCDRLIPPEKCTKTRIVKLSLFFSKYNVSVFQIFYVKYLLALMQAIYQGNYLLLVKCLPIAIDIRYLISRAY